MDISRNHVQGGRLAVLVQILYRKVLAISPRDREIVAGLTVPILLLAALLVGEGALRYEQFLAFGPNQVFEEKVNQSVWEMSGFRRKPRPGVSMGRVRFNSAGFRGTELAMPKPPATIRIGFFGSSTTLDAYIPSDASTWPAIAASRLRSAFPKCAIDFFNAGVVGYGTDSMKGRLLEDALPFEPDVAAFMISDDTTRGRINLQSRGFDIKAYRPSWFARKSILWLKFEKNWEVQRLMRIAARSDIANRLNIDEIAAGLRRDTSDLAQTATKHGILPVFIESAPRIRKEQSRSEQIEYASSRLLYLPRVFIGDLTGLIYRYHETLRAVAAENGFPYIETINRMPDGAAFYADSTHTSAKGSKALGEIVGAAMAANPAIRAIIDRRGGGCL